MNSKDCAQLGKAFKGRPREVHDGGFTAHSFCLRGCCNDTASARSPCFQWPTHVAISDWMWLQIARRTFAVEAQRQVYDTLKMREFPRHDRQNYVQRAVPITARLPGRRRATVHN
jgi:hypothetical protein